MVIQGEIVCKESVVMENGEHVGQEAFTAGKKYQVSSVNVYDTMVTIVSINNFGKPHVLLNARVHPVDTEFIRRTFEP